MLSAWQFLSTSKRWLLSVFYNIRRSFQSCKSCYYGFIQVNVNIGMHQALRYSVDSQCFTFRFVPGNRSYALVIGFPEGGDPGLMWGNTGTLWGLCNKFLPLWWGKCGDLDFWMPYSRGKYGDFAYVQLRGDWGRFLFARSMARWRRRTRRYVLKSIVFKSTKK